MEFIKGMDPVLTWAILGVVLIFAELFIPGVVIAFFGAGALITALTTWAGLTPGASSQLLVFLFASPVLLFLFRKYLKKTFLGVSKEAENIDFNIEVGKIVPVIELIDPETFGGKVRYQGTPWSARASERIAPGESVKIKGFDNLTLIVERIESKTKED